MPVGLFYPQRQVFLSAVSFLHPYQSTHVRQAEPHSGGYAVYREDHVDCSQDPRHIIYLPINRLTLPLAILIGYPNVFPQKEIRLYPWIVTIYINTFGQDYGPFELFQRFYYKFYQ